VLAFNGFEGQQGEALLVSPSIKQAAHFKAAMGNAPIPFRHIEIYLME
jgi:hypothetical protein